VRVVWVLIAIVLVLWLLGLALDIAGAFVNVLLVVAAVALVLQLARRNGGASGREGVTE
jgi:hypothetical protein